MLKYSVILLVAGCEPFASSWPLSDSLDPEPRPGQFTEIGIARDDVISLTGDDPGGGVEVRWSVRDCPLAGYSGTTAVYTGGRCYHGITFSCSSIFVAERSPVGDSALRHEVLHCFHGRVYGSYDPGHQNSKWWDMDRSGTDRCNIDDQ